MSNSKLVNKKLLIKRNYDKGRDGRKIKKITIHHAAGVVSVKDLYNLMKSGSRQVSSHYGIGNDGQIGQYVDEKNTAWTDGNWESNCTSVTIETSNNKRGGKWTVGDKALNSLIKLVADIGKRNKLGTLKKGKNVTWHRMYASTTCPGDYLLSKMDYIIKEANKINASGSTIKKPFNLTRKLKKGCTGSDVKKLQKKLNVTADGIFGEQTLKALVKYQKSKGWTPSGVVRTKTAHSLGWLYKGK